MRHYLYAVLDSTEQATHALRALESAGTPSKHCGVLLHRDRLRTEELPLGETSMRAGAASGALVGGALGALLGGLVLGPLGLVGAGTAFATALAASAGVAEGALFGAIAGASSPDGLLERLQAELRAGRVLLSVEAPDQRCAERAEKTLVAEGARVLHRPLL
jgi:hypothetical protein